MKRISELISLRDRVALITGGAGHIGSAIAEGLAELGANIVVLDLTLKSCSLTCEGIMKHYPVKTLPVVADLLKEEEIRNIPEKITRAFERLDILVNCAAFVGTSNLEGWITPFENQRADSWRQALEVNLTAPFLMTQACAPMLRESEHGSVINIASTYGVVGPDMRLYEGTDMGNPAAYAGSKGGLIQLTRWLATVLAPDIRVNAVTPGGVWRNQPDVFHDRYVERTPLRRMATEEDFKGAVAYLATDLSSYVTGHNLVVDGGWTTW